MQKSTPSSKRKEGRIEWYILFFYGGGRIKETKHSISPSGIAIIQKSTWKGNDEYVYTNESFINILHDDAPNEKIDPNPNTSTDNNSNEKDQGVLDSLIQKLF